MAVKLIASDLDGTLLRNDKSISEETGKALEKAREAGIYFVPSTGRALEAVPVEVMALPGVEYVITSNALPCIRFPEGPGSMKVWFRQKQ